MKYVLIVIISSVLVGCNKEPRALTDAEVLADPYKAAEWSEKLAQKKKSLYEEAWECLRKGECDVFEEEY